MNLRVSRASVAGFLVAAGCAASDSNHLDQKREQQQAEACVGEADHPFAFAGPGDQHQDECCRPQQKRNTNEHFARL